MASFVRIIPFFISFLLVFAHANAAKPPNQAQVKYAVGQWFQRQNTNTDEGGTAIYLNTLEVIETRELPAGKGFRVKVKITDASNNGSAFDVISKPYLQYFILTPIDDFDSEDSWQAKKG